MTHMTHIKLPMSVFALCLLSMLTMPALAAPEPAKAPAVAAPQEADGDDNEESPPAKEAGKPAAKPEEKAPTPSAVNGRLTLGTSVGWAVIKPAKGTWTGLGTSDIMARWRNSAKEGGKLYITGRYAPFAGVWRVNRRDYDTTLHGFFGGTEYLMPMGSMNLKAGVELGYLLVYAKPQDGASASSDVKGGKVNISAGGGADWGFFSDKVRIGPFARVHFAGFSIVNIGGSAQFVF